MFVNLMARKTYWHSNLIRYNQNLHSQRLCYYLLHLHIHVFCSRLPYQHTIHYTRYKPMTLYLHFVVYIEEIALEYNNSGYANHLFRYNGSREVLFEAQQTCRKIPTRTQSHNTFDSKLLLLQLYSLSLWIKEPCGQKSKGANLKKLSFRFLPIYIIVLNITWQ